MGMSCFFVETWTRIITVSCFSFHLCSQLSPISCVACVCLHVFVQLCVILCLCTAVCGRQFLRRVDIFMQIYLFFLSAVYGNVVLSLSNIHVHWKSLVFFRSLLLTAVANLMFCVYVFAYFAHICVILCLCAAVCGRQFLSGVEI